jgi:hypothetical protein
MSMLTSFADAELEGPDGGKICHNPDTETVVFHGSTDGVWCPCQHMSAQHFPKASVMAYLKCSALVKVLCGLQISHTWTGTPFLALLTRPVMGVSLTCMSDGGGWEGIGLMGPPPPLPVDDDEAVDPYPCDWSIESVLVVLVRRAEGRLALGVKDGDALSVSPVLALVPTPVAVDVVFVDEADDLETRDEAPRLLVWGGGTGRLISSSVARPGLLACLGRPGGLVVVGASWR